MINKPQWMQATLDWLKSGAKGTRPRKTRNNKAAKRTQQARRVARDRVKRKLTKRLRQRVQRQRNKGR